jgi:hypothetical protein
MSRALITLHLNEPPRVPSGPVERLVIPIYGVGDASAEDVRQGVQQMLDRNPEDNASTATEVLDWDKYTPHRADESEIWYSANWFAETFINVAYYRLWLQPRAFVVAAITLHLLLVTTAIPTLILIPLATVFWVFGVLQGLGKWENQSQPLLWAIHNTSYLQSATAAVHLIPKVSLPLIHGCLAVAILSVTFALLESLKQRSGVPLWSCVRTIAFLLLVGPCVVFSLLLVEKPKQYGFFSAFKSCNLVLGFLGLLLTLLVNAVSGSGLRGLSTVAFAVAIFLAMSLLRALMSLLTRSAAKTWLVGAKVLLDVSLYIGSPVRHRIQCELNKLISSRATEGTTVWIVAHSLGSVIALDSLLHSATWRKSQRVILITCGSPLRRLFARFFAGLLFPADLREASGMVAKRLAEFRWVNVYRPLDYIGMRLRLLDRGAEATVRRLWPWHTQYWQDTKAHEQVRSLLASATAVAPAEQNASHDVYGVTSAFPLHIERTEKLMYLVGPILATVLTLGLWFVLPIQPKPTIAFVSMRQTTARITQEAYFGIKLRRQHKFRLEFTAEDKPQVLTVETSWFQLGADVPFDWERLSHDIQDRCVPEHAVRWYQPRSSIPCTRDGILIEFDVSRPWIFRLPGFPPLPPSALMSRFETILYFFFMIVTSFVCISGALRTAQVAVLPVGHSLAIGDAASWISDEKEGAPETK